MARAGIGRTFALVGDGSYLMMNSDIYASVLSGRKFILVVCDNEGYAVIERLPAAFPREAFYLPPAEASARLGDLILDQAESRHGVDWRAVLAGFIDRTDRTRALLEGVMPEAAWLDDGDPIRAP